MLLAPALYLQLSSVELIVLANYTVFYITIGFQSFYSYLRFWVVAEIAG